MESKVELYESMMVNAGKTRESIWSGLAMSVLKESYFKDKAIYGSATRDLYGILFEDETLFESIDERVFQLNEADVGADMSKSRWNDVGTSSKQTSSSTNDWRDAGTNSMGVTPKLDGFGAFANKIKGFFETFGGNVAKYFSGGIAGVIANPFPLIAAGASAGLVVALVRKFKKMSDAKKEAAKAKLPSDMKKKLEVVLDKDEAELKDELAKKEKKESKVAASVDTEMYKGEKFGTNTGSNLVTKSKIRGDTRTEREQMQNGSRKESSSEKTFQGTKFGTNTGSNLVTKAKVRGDTRTEAEQRGSRK